MAGDHTSNWGIVIIHPVDNLLGPVLVGTTLRLHALVMFFAVIGGLAAFGGAGIVVGPVVASLVVALAERSDASFYAPGLSFNAPGLRETSP